MEYTEIIARDADSLPPEKQAEVLDFIAFLKIRQSRAEEASVPKTPGEIEAFSRSFNVDTRNYKFDREEVNTHMLRS